MSHFSIIFQIFCIFDSDQEKYAIFVILTKNKVIYDAESINMWMSADEACRFTNFSNITS